MQWLSVFFGIFILTACASQYPKQNPVNQAFPKVKGSTLSQKSVTLPKDVLGRPSVLLLGFEQKTQFDIDRWLIGLDMANIQCQIFELPTINNWLAQLFATRIDNGMRSGIPSNLWSSVITIYQDGDKLQQFTGNQQPNNARVIVLDAKGEVKYFYDQGFAVRALNGLRGKLLELEPSCVGQ